MTTDDIADPLRRLVAIMGRLRQPDGCPWDQVQTFQSIAPYTIEEAYEVADAIIHQDAASLRDELGDLLLQVVYHSRIAQEDGLFTFDDVASSIAEKMVRRHPHVFASADARNVDEQNRAWEDQKVQERAQRQEHQVLAGVATALPGLTRATKLTRRAARVGFDWPDVAAVFHKLTEETEELQAELPLGAPERLADEMGDLLFVVANLARKLDLDPEACLRQANAKFERRFNGIEALASRRGSTLSELSLPEMEELWSEVKRGE
ncbi:nucleoside triphosphate pyrophosphohydrolase [Pseudoroseomonas globiformis]|uniref:Nucleoside triphosphate pyrophosphohydrolase n=1 Tax=Teichococcus globiformis TaxID=2307229 RepID=A0ABV7FZ11_9PROT